MLEIQDLSDFGAAVRHQPLLCSLSEKATLVLLQPWEIHTARWIYDTIHIPLTQGPIKLIKLYFQPILHKR